ncbi:invasion associated locus B family protein [Shimia sp. SDUM112013]|uniref:invasion associated locus B family protein n=1 Tax=Shimia sp. SDUM112013 TaxID=3136160 RepID=UPI0032EC81BC
MKNTALSLATLAVMALSAPAFAQGVGSLSNGTLEMGETVTNSNPAPVDDVTNEAFGDWNLQCAKTGPEPRPCRMYQLLKDGAGTPVAEVTAYRLPEGSAAAAGATFVVPLETLLTAQLSMTIDGTSTKRYPFAFCNTIGCFARIGFTAEEVEELKGGSKASLGIVPARNPSQPVTVIMSLNGFTAAYDKSTVVPE